MHAFEDIPPAALRKAPRIWVNTEGGFGRRIIDPRWVTMFRNKDEAAKERDLRRAEDAEQRRQRAAALALVARKDRDKVQAELRRLGREAIEEAKRFRWEAVAARWAETGPLSSGRAVIEAVAQAHGVTVGAITGKSRVKHIVIARQHAVYEIRRQRRISYPQIAKLIGLKDHTTCLHAVEAWPKKAAALGIQCEPIGEAR